MPATLDVLLSSPSPPSIPTSTATSSALEGLCLRRFVARRQRPLRRGYRSSQAARPPILRWPGGCFADDYHWQDGIGPRKNRPGVLISIGAASSSPTTSAPMTSSPSAELSSATLHLRQPRLRLAARIASNWVEYCNHPSGSTLPISEAPTARSILQRRILGRRQRTWGLRRPFHSEDYATEYRRFATYLRDFGETPLHLIAAGPDGNDLDWTRRFFEKLNDYRPFTRIHSYAAHYYCGTAGTATEYTEGNGTSCS